MKPTSLVTVAASSAFAVLLCGCPKKDAGASDASVEAAAPAVEVELPFDQRVAKTKPLDIKVEDQTIPGGKVTAEVCEMEGGPIVSKSNMSMFKSVREVGDRLLTVMDDDSIHAYKVVAGAKCKLTIDKTFGTNGVVKFDKVELLAKDDAGDIWASTGVFGAKKFGKDGKETGKCDAHPLGYLYIDGAGKNGIGTFANSTVAKVTLNPDGTCKTEPWAFVDLSQDDKRKGPFTNAQAVAFVGDTIYMGAIIAKPAPGNGSTIVAALDAKGVEKFRMGKTDNTSGDDHFGWVHAISACKVGVCVLDSNYRRITMWKGKGEFVGSVNLSKLFGLKYPWFSGFDMDKTGNMWVVAGQDREGAKGVAEGNVYRVKGL